MNLYCTADEIGEQTGGGIVTYNENEAIKFFGESTVISRKSMGINTTANPFMYDTISKALVRNIENIKLAHFYSGTFTNTIDFLKARNVKITYTCAAHDLQLSINEYNKLGTMYPYKHMVDNNLFREYVDGYLKADVVICPSKNSAMIMQNYGCKNVVIIPHGINEVMDLGPAKFSVGYLGQTGLDKGIRYLLEAWKKLNTKDSLILGGSKKYEMLGFSRIFGGGNIKIIGYVPNVIDFYKQCAVYCQPSVTEGFGIEVLEAMSYGRPVICSEGAGAADVIEDGVDGFIVPRCDPDAIADKITLLKSNENLLKYMSMAASEKAKRYLWTDIRKQYIKLWSSI